MCRLLIAACWKEDTHERPTFPVILQTLDDVARSKFHQMDDDNFYDLQDDWKAEIDETLHEIREREKVKYEYGAEFLALKHESRILGHSYLGAIHI